MQQRSSFVDTLKGIGIILVVWGHCAGHQFMQAIYSFHIPLFLFLSGYVFSHKPLKETIIGRAKRLLWPYFVYYVLTLLFQCAIQVILYVVSKRPIQLSLTPILQLVDGSEKLSYNVPLWFLVCLFWVAILYTLLVKYFSGIRLSISVLLLTLMGYWAYKNQLNMPYYADSALSSVLFFYLGEQWHKIHKNNTVTFVDSWYFLVLSMIVFVVLMQFSGNIDIRTNKIESPLVVYIGAALAGIALCWSVAQKINYQPILDFLGKHSLIIMCVHTPLFIVTDIIMAKLMPFLIINSFVGSCVRAVLALGLSAVITLFLKRVLLKMRVA